MLDFMNAHDIGTSNIRRLRGKTPGLYMINLKDGERSFSYSARQFCRPPARSRLRQAAHSDGKPANVRLLSPASRWRSSCEDSACGTLIARIRRYKGHRRMAIVFSPAFFALLEVEETDVDSVLIDEGARSSSSSAGLRWSRPPIFRRRFHRRHHFTRYLAAVASHVVV